MLPPKYLSASKPRKSWAPDLYELDSDLSEQPDATVGGGATDSEFFHQRFRNFVYVEVIGPRKTLITLRKLCLDWLQPDTHTKEEIVELLVLEQYLTILPERMKPWVRAKQPQSCEKLVTLLERYKEMYEPEDHSSDIRSEDSMGRKRAESPPPRAAYFYRDRNRDWDQDWDRDQDQHWDRDRAWDQLRERDRLREWDQRGRRRDLEFRERWPCTRSPRSRFPQRDLSLPMLEKTTFAMERGRRRRNFMMEYESEPQDTMSYQDVLDLTEDRKLQNPIQDNMENYRKLLSLGVQLAEDDGHSPMTQGHSRSKRSAYPSTRRGLKTMPETKKSTHRRGICEDDSSHGMIMEKFIKDASRNPRSGRARDSNDPSPRFPTRPDHDWKDVSFKKRESVGLRERGREGNAFGGGGFSCHSDLVSKKRVVERKRRYQCDTDDQRGCPRKKPFEYSDMKKAMSMCGLSSPSFTKSEPLDFRAMPYVCDECGRAFSVISEFVEHQIMHTRENLYEYGESFIHSVAVSEVRKSQARGKRFECKEGGETCSKSAAFAEHGKIHSREYFTECNDEECEEPFMPSPTFSELQKMYGKDKFYECKVCKETFLHSSALIKHQKKAHGRDDKDDERGETFKPSPAFHELQKMYAKEKMHECKVCGETFRHSSSLKGHQKIHTRANLFESKGRVREETFIPGQSLKRQQKTYMEEKLYDFKDGGGAFRLNSGFSEHHKILSRKVLYESRGYGKSVIHSVPFTESQKSHTITRPPEGDEDEKAFTISSNPDNNWKMPTEENVCERKPNERSVIHSVASVEAQESHTAVGPNKPKVVAEAAAAQSSNVTKEVRAGDEASEGKKYERSVIHSLATFKLPKSLSGNERDEKGESSTYIADRNGKEQKIPARVNPYEESKKNTVICSVSYTEPPKSLSGEGAGEVKKDGQSSVSSSDAQEQKAQVKKKNVERRNCETSVIHSLRFGEPETFRPREKLYECPECGESFVRSSDLTEHQKIHHRKKPPGSQTYELSVIHSLAPAEPQMSSAGQPAHTTYAQQSVVISCTQQPVQTGDTQQPAQTGDAQQPVQMGDAQQPAQTGDTQQGDAQQPMQTGDAQQPVQTGDAQQPAQMGAAQQPAQTGDAQQPAQTGDAQQPVQTGDAQQPVQTGDAQQPAQTGDAQQPAQTGDTQQPAQTGHAEEPAQAGNTQQPAQPECKDCGQRFATIEDLGAHQKIYSKEEFNVGKPFEDSEDPDGPEQEEEEEEEDEEEEDEQEEDEDEIYGCKDCGLGFADRADLKDHRKVHNRGYRINTREYTRSVIHTHPFGEYQAGDPGNLLFECPACGESFVHSSFLFEHQKVHEEDPFYGQRRYEPFFMRPLVINPQRFHAPQKNPSTGLFLQCQLCGQDFIHGSVFNEHLALHTGENSLEQGQRSGEAVSSGLALTELQRSQAEEKRYECETCGESFLSQSDLKDHMRIHEKDEPYDYGDSFIHTSFLTDPPRRDSPFFECKDCGKSFIHNTVLIKHQKLHLEEEEAAAQEVEANALVPQEVAQVQGSNVEAAEPEAEAAEPEAEAAEPGVEAAEPDGEAAEPDAEAEQPDVDAEQPNGDADEPDGAGIEDPEERAEEPEGKAEEPQGDADEPDGAGIEDPEEEGEDQEIEVEEPYYDCRECGETFTSNAAYGEHLKSHARVIIFEQGNVYGEGSHYTEHASTSTGDQERADDKYFKCDVCGQLFGDRLSLARHQNTHTG